MQPTEPAIGAPCWAELGTTDVPSSGEFYSTLFGWAVSADSHSEAGGYTLAALGDAYVASMSPLYAPSQPIAWTVSFAVLDAEVTTARAAEHGGRVLMAPTDVFDSGRFAVLRDPTGAMFSIWQPRTFPGFGRWDEPGAACWAELATRDVPTATAFYQALLGWTVSGDASYPHLSAGDRRFGGIQDMNATGVPEAVTPHWLLYFKVQDTAATTAQAVELGAETLSGPFHLPGTGYFATLRDPQGAVFALYQEEGESAEAA
jgi:predicted enzyme related to lactoylglutathione lyase